MIRLVGTSLPSSIDYREVFVFVNRSILSFYTLILAILDLNGSRGASNLSTFFLDRLDTLGVGLLPAALQIAFRFSRGEGGDNL